MPIPLCQELGKGKRQRNHLLKFEINKCIKKLATKIIYHIENIKSLIMRVEVLRDKVN